MVGAPVQASEFTMRSSERPAAGRRRLALPERLSLLVSGLLAVFLLVLAAGWLYLTRLGIHEEVQAAKRVSQQWLQAVAARRPGLPAADLLDIVRAAGRVRAHAISVHAAAMPAPLYVSPASPYKAGRAAPAWFAALLAPDIPPLTLRLGELRIVLAPDASRAILDAWDDLLAFASWALLSLLCLFFAVGYALRSALRPLQGLRLALQQTGEGNFAIRLPAMADPELTQLACAFNQMADRLDLAVRRNVRLESERRRIALVEAALQAERQDLAREVHDELAQGVTAVRTLAAAIEQRVGADAAPLGSMAARIGSVAAGLQTEVRRILLRLREALPGNLPAALTACVDAWQACQTGVAVELNVAFAEADVPAPVLRTAQRLVQEALTNVVRHSTADRVVISLQAEAGGLGIAVADNGREKVASPAPMPGSGLGLAGLRERVALLGGRVDFGRCPAAGWQVRAWLPLGAPGGAA